MYNVCSKPLLIPLKVCKNNGFWNKKKLKKKLKIKLLIKYKSASKSVPKKNILYSW